MLYNPIYEFERMQTLLDDLFRAPALDEDLAATADLNAANLYENDQAYMIQIPAPGVQADGVAVNYENGQLTVSIERREDNTGKKLVRRERGSLKTARTYSVSGDVDVNGIEARLINGLLMVIVPRKEQAKPRKIAVQVQ